MGKAEPGSLKALSNRMKAKGLQKLKWYCQMCEKQCRDENGFKCHIMSESHQRQMILFSENSREFVDTFSQDFEREFVKLLKRRFGTRRVHANMVYKEYISDRNHLHMNSTEWGTLTEFCKHLGRTGVAEVDETPKGWFIKYIDRDPDVLARQEALRKREMSQLDEEERQRLMLEEQISRAKENEKEEDVAFTEFTKENEDEKITLDLSIKPLTVREDSVESGATEQSNGILKPKTLPKLKSVFGDDDDNDESPPSSKPSTNDVFDAKKKKTAMEDIMQLEENKKEKQKRKDNWITKGIVVKVLNKKLADGAYYKLKGVIKQVHDTYIAEIEMNDSGDIIKIDQINCETVIPSVGGRVKIVNGAYRGELADLVALNVDKFNATLKIVHGPYNERILEKIDYEDFSKYVG